MNRRSLFVFFILIMIIGFTSCNQGGSPPDVSNIPMHIRVERFDREFMTINPSHLQEGLLKLQRQYPAFFPVYMNRIMNFNYPGPDSGKAPDPIIKKFIQSKDIQGLQDSIDAHFPPEKIAHLQKELNESFRYIKYYFPKFHPPGVVTFMSALSNYGAITVDSVLGIGLDMFMGSDFPLYKQVASPYPGYILNRFSPNNIVVSCIKVLAREECPPLEKGTLLEHMINRGKILYYVDKVLPETADHSKINYSQKQLDWCKKNEQFIWQYFIRNNLLYKNSNLTIRYYIGPSPTSRGMPKKAPGNIGSWIGWQIVRQYMKKNPQTTLSQLMKLKDAQQLLTSSEYHPH